MAESALVDGALSGTGHDDLSSRLHRLSGQLRTLDEEGARVRFGLRPSSQLLKTTLSLCDVCLHHVPAAIHVEGEQVIMRSLCAVHGMRDSVLENDHRFYSLSNKDGWGRRYGAEVHELPRFSGCCGDGTGAAAALPAWAHDFTDQRGNKSCTVLVEITNACNLACRVCYADSRGDRILPVEHFKAHLLRLIAQKGSLDSVQITGGEASLHPGFWEILDWLHGVEEVGKIYLPTNGLQLSRPQLARRLRPYRDKLLVLLQFDGAEVATNRALRGANPLVQRMRLVKELNRHGIAMQFTMTLAHGVSEQEIAWVVRQGIRHRHVRLIGMLPVFFSARYELPVDPLTRLTLSDVVKGVAAGLPGKARREDFMAIPCSHPNCGWTTLFARRFGLFFNIARHVDLDAVMDDVAYKTVLDRKEVHSALGSRYRRGVKRLLARMGRRLIRPRDVFGIAIKPFMDRYSYDQDRISACCHHMLDTRGNLVSFCEYNARLRETDSWSRMPSLSGGRTVNLEGLRGE